MDRSVLISDSVRIAIARITKGPVAVTATHKVKNQTPPLAGNAFQDDPLLMQAASGAPDTMLKEWLDKAGPDGQAMLDAFRK